MVFGRRRHRSHADRVFRDVSRRHGFMRGTMAYVAFRLIMLVVWLMVCVGIVAVVGAYIWFTQ